MSTLTDNFAKAYPKYALTEFKNEFIIHESQNDGKSKLQEIKFTGVSGYLIPNAIIKATSSFAKQTGHDGHLLKDCDGIMIFDKDDKQYMVFCELKSGYNTSDISKARNQIVASFLKMRAVLGTIQGYELDDYNVIGLIVSFAPTQEEKTRLMKDLSSEKNFAVKLQDSRVYNMPSASCIRHFKPLNVNIDFQLRYAPVPNRKPTYTINLASVLGI